MLLCTLLRKNWLMMAQASMQHNESLFRVGAECEEDPKAKNFLAGQVKFDEFCWVWEVDFGGVLSLELIWKWKTTCL